MDKSLSKPLNLPVLIAYIHIKLEKKKNEDQSSMTRKVGYTTLKSMVCWTTTLGFEVQSAVGCLGLDLFYRQQKKTYQHM
jgi:ABC-type tungstate transport system substrate-binding protein